MDRPARIGSYVVESELGRGGAGVVYLARDVDLDRAVAIKTLPPDVARDGERLAQLEREAKVVATLSHANIATIHGLLKEGDERFLVLEYVPGHSLDELLAKAPLPIDQALACARDVADGLEAAHDKGIVHRDLKPANVRRTPDGVVKVLDFGLAKELREDLAGASQSGHTSAIVGTPAYLSPEQIRGRPADRGADVWAFGCLLYELLAGRPAFRGASVGDLLQAVLETAPDLDVLPPRTPPRVVELIRRCLHRDRRQRLRDLGDARIELEHAIAERSSSRAIEPVRGGRRRATLLPAAAAVLAVGALLGWVVAALSSASPESSPPVRLSFPLYEARSSGRLVEGLDVLQLSNDGRTFAVQKPLDGVPMVFLRRIDAFGFEPVPGTEGVRRFCFSPDGTELAVTVPVSKESNDLQLVRLPVDGGGPPSRLGSWLDREMAWLPGGEIVVGVGPPPRLLFVPEQGGEVRVLDCVWPDGQAVFGPHRPVALPNGHVLAEVESFRDLGYEISVVQIDPGTGRMTPVVRDAGSARFAPTGHLLFTRQDQLFAASYDPSDPASLGDPFGLFGGLRTRDSWSHAELCLAASGTLAFLDGGRQGADRRIAVLDRDGNETPWSDDRMAFEERLAVCEEADWMCVTRVSPAGFYQVWGSRLSQPGLRLLNAEPGCDVHYGQVSPDGAWLYFQLSGHASDNGVHRVALDGTGRRERVVAADAEAGDLVPLNASADGRLLLVADFSAGFYTLLLVDVADPERRAVRFAEGRRNAPGGDLDRRGRWACYMSSEGGLAAPCVRRVDAADLSVGPELRVPLPAGEAPHSVAWWHRGDPNRLDLIVWFAQARRAVVVPCTERGDTLGFDPPEPLLDLRDAPTVDWSLLADGRVLAIRPDPGEFAAVHVQVVTDIRPALRAASR